LCAALNDAKNCSYEILFLSAAKCLSSFFAPLQAIFLPLFADSYAIRGIPDIAITLNVKAGRQLK